MAHDYQLIVIGSGPAGRRAAIQAAKLGKSVVVVEGRARVGGVSVHTGTIPSKTLRETALNLSGWRERGFYGRSYRVKKEIGRIDLSNRLDKTLDHEVDVLEHQFQRNGVETMAGFARFVDPHSIAVDLAHTLAAVEIVAVFGAIPVACCPANDLDDRGALGAEQVIVAGPQRRHSCGRDRWSVDSHQVSPACACPENGSADSGRGCNPFRDRARHRLPRSPAPW